jgi:hypothetical protein
VLQQADGGVENPEANGILSQTDFFTKPSQIGSSSKNRDLDAYDAEINVTICQK